MNAQLTAICSALDFIEANLKEDIRVEDMAEACGYSLFYFIRLFDQSVHLTPYDYLIRRRLSRAAEELLAGDRRQIDVALEYGFQNAETFTRAFNRVFGLLPSQARKKEALDLRLILRACGPAQLTYFQTCGLPQVRKVEEPQHFLAGFPSVEDLNARTLEGALTRLRTYAPRNRTFYWLSSCAAQPGEGAPIGFAGFELADWDALPPDLYARRLPAESCAGFRQNDLLENLACLRAYVYQYWQANSSVVFGSRVEVFRISLTESGPELELLVPLSVSA